MDPHWQDPCWLADTHAWIDTRLLMLDLTRTGDIEQAHVSSRSTVLRIPTASGDVWFKTNDVSLRHEAALVELLVSCTGNALEMS